MMQPFIDVFGVSPLAVLAYLGLHLHLYLVGRRVARVEKTATVARELRAAHSHPSK